MKKIKYYYSNAVHLRTIQVVTDAEGNPLFIPDVKPLASKKLPRVTVASVWYPEERKMVFGSSICAPMDNFKKSVGRELALKRALEFPEIIIKITSRNRISDISKRYADQLISQHSRKNVRFNP